MLWAKFLEWEAEKDPTIEITAFDDLCPRHRAAVLVLTAHFTAAADAIAELFPRPVEAPDAAPPRPTPIEDTIFERHGSLGERDEHRVAANTIVEQVQGVLAAAGIKAKVLIDEEEDDGSDDGDGAKGEGDDGEGAGGGAGDEDGESVGEDDDGNITDEGPEFDPGDGSAMGTGDVGDGSFDLTATEVQQRLAGAGKTTLDGEEVVDGGLVPAKKRR